MRLDQYLVSNNLVKTRSIALDLIKQGLVKVNEKSVTKAGYQLNDLDVVEVLRNRQFVSRAGEKLLDAIDYFKISLKDKIVIDVGSSTGGFTDCCLQHQAKLVYAYDVGKDQLDLSLRNDSRVILHEQTNILSVTIPDHDLLLIDVSFTSVKPIIKHLRSRLSTAIILLKPQFEVTPQQIKNGVIKNDRIINEVLTSFNEFLKFEQIEIVGSKPCSLSGKKGNQEYLFYIKG